MNQTELRKYTGLPPDYPTDSDCINKFILFYNEDEEYKYLTYLREKRVEIPFHLDDLALYDGSGLTKRIEDNGLTYLNMIYTVIDSVLFNEEEILDTDEDVFFYHRISRFKEKFPDGNITEVFPSYLLRNYTVNIVPKSTSRIFPVRQIKAEHIGKLVRISGIVTRVSQVKPSVKVATYICESCGSEIYQQVEGDSFDMLEECSSEKCKIKNVKGTLLLVSRGSKFMKYQTLHIQELTVDVPHGCIPRMMKVECYGSVTEKCLPGDVVIVGGIFTPRPYHGIRKMKAGLLTDTFLLATHIETPRGSVIPTNSTILHPNSTILHPNSTILHPNSTILHPNSTILHPNSNINSLIQNIAPEIYGMTDIKKILLLMLAGAPTKVKEDGMKIRGDINVLLLGDPGIAKSQLLKTAVKISRRGIYTTGKGSSGVGLTASVTKDPVTGEIVLEGGALVLADKGVCCIDELDKMSEFDRISIHEVMEQQTVNISKAGINTTLNARCGILAAANPIRGRYDNRHSVEWNVGLPCSLISRFDIIAVLRDEPDRKKDEELAEHITAIHMEEEKENINYQEIRNYLERIKEVEPVIPQRLNQKLTSAYVKARKESFYVTPRYLLSLIRMSLAHARLRMSEEVEEEDVEEALRLMEMTRISAENPRIRKRDTKREVYNLIMSLVREEEGQKKIRLSELWKMSEGKYAVTEVEDIISDFAACGIWMRNNEEIIVFD